MCVVPVIDFIWTNMFHIHLLPPLLLLQPPPPAVDDDDRGRRMTTTTRNNENENRVLVNSTQFLTLFYSLFSVEIREVATTMNWSGSCNVYPGGRLEGRRRVRPSGWVAGAVLECQRVSASGEFSESDGVCIDQPPSSSSPRCSS